MDPNKVPVRGDIHVIIVGMLLILSVYIKEIYPLELTQNLD
jgi:hypothetical protein